MSQKKHPLEKATEQEKVQFLSIVAVIAKADKKVTDDEIAHLRKACKELGLSADGIGRVIAAAEEPEIVPVKAYIEGLRKSELRFTLVTDMLYLAHADSIYSDTEKKEILSIAKQMGVNSDQVEAMEKYVKAVLKAAKSEVGSKEQWKKLGGEVAGGLASAGVPIAAVAASGSVLGLSAAGITSGLAALGLGLGMATGIGIAAAIGVASYFGIKWIYKKVVG